MAMPVARRKRPGAPLSNDPRKQHSRDSSDDPEQTFAQQYEMLQNSYSNRNPTQQSLLYLKRIASDAVIPMEFKRYPLLRLLNEIAKDMLMNELEVVGWSVYLDRFVWGGEPADLHRLLLFSGLAVKIYFDSDVEVIKAHIRRKNVRLHEQFEAWSVANESEMKIHPKEMNDKFRKLNAFPDPSDIAALLDYNYIVDEILQLSPPYNAVDVESAEVPAEGEEESFEEIQTQMKGEAPSSPEDFAPLSLSRNGSLGSQLDFQLPTSMLRQASTSAFWESAKRNP